MRQRIWQLLDGPANLQGYYFVVDREDLCAAQKVSAAELIRILGRVVPPGRDGADGEDGLMIPGPPGARGPRGLRGAPAITIPGFDGADGEAVFVPPQPQRERTEFVRVHYGTDTSTSSSTVAEIDNAVRPTVFVPLSGCVRVVFSLLLRAQIGGAGGQIGVSVDSGASFQQATGFVFEVFNNFKLCYGESIYTGLPHGFLTLQLGWGTIGAGTVELVAASATAVAAASWLACQTLP